MFRWMTVSAALATATIMFSAREGWGQVPETTNGRDSGSAIPVPEPSQRFRPRYVSPYSARVTSYTPSPTWPINGYPPSHYASFVTTGLPTYLTSRHYPTVYGAYQYNGVTWAGGGGGMASVSQRPWSTYPNENYSPVSPPTEAAFSHFSPVYQLSPGSTGVGGPANLTASGPAIIDIHVPSDANVWIQGMKMTQSGELRRFISPNLGPHQRYSYNITARWIDNDDNLVVLNRRVIVKPGDHEAVNFVQPVPSRSILRSRELP